MSLNFRFAIATDLHIGLPHTIPNHPMRFHRIEISIPNFNSVMEQLSQLDVDFLLIPGDLTQNGEPENHEWLSQALAQLPFPAYVIPGNHDALEQKATDTAIGIDEFPSYYEKHGYGKYGYEMHGDRKNKQGKRAPEVSESEKKQLYYTCNPLPGLRLIGLNSIAYNDDGKQHYTGYIDQPQLDWLQQVLATSWASNGVKEEIFVMIHHNVLEHLPNQTKSKLGRRYMLENAPALIEILQEFGVQLVFTGHLHVQDIAYHPQANLFDITTGSLVSYPHPYRICRYCQNDAGRSQLMIESRRIRSAPGWPDLQLMSRDFVQDHSLRFIRRLLTEPPLNLSEAEAEPLLPHLRHIWADVANGDVQFDFSHLPDPVRRFFEAFSAQEQWDNHAILDLNREPRVSTLGG